MKVVLQSKMVEIDRKTINEYKVPSIVLMENAGIAIIDQLIKDYPVILKKDSKINILIGIGNNGGDGSVIARQLHNKGICSDVYCVGNREKIKGDALINLTILENIGFDVTFIGNDGDWLLNQHVLVNCDFLIEGLFGTGLKSPLKGLYAEVVAEINEKCKGNVISIDVPSGLWSSEAFDDSGLTIINATQTYTIGLPKVGMLDYPGRKYVGDLRVINIGFPKELLTSDKLKYNWVTTELARKMLPARMPNSHKGSYGHLFVIGGSKYYSGATTLTCKSAQSTGCGLVTLCSIPVCCDATRSLVPEVIYLPVGQNDDGYISSESIDCILSGLSDIGNKGAVVLGPGIGQHQHTIDLVNAFMDTYEGKVVIDADGLNILSQNIELLNSSKCDLVLTPHVKEMSRLCDTDLGEIKRNKVKHARDFATKYNVVLVLKDAITIVALPDGQIYYNTTGNNGMAKGGSGDVLSGIIGSLLTQGLSTKDAAVLGVYLHGKSGDYAAKEYSEYSMTPYNICECLDQTFGLLTKLLN